MDVGAAKVAACLARLPERERRVLALRFGLAGVAPRTLDEAGRAIGVTRERVRQIQNRALARLRDSPGVQRLRDLTGD